MSRFRVRVLQTLGYTLGFAAAVACESNAGEGSETHFECKEDADCAPHGAGYLCVDLLCRQSDGGGEPDGSGKGGGPPDGGGAAPGTGGASSDGGGTGGSSAGGASAAGAGGTSSGGAPFGDGGSSTARTVSVGFTATLGANLLRCQSFANPFGRAANIGEIRVQATPWLVRMWIYREPGAIDGVVGNCPSGTGTDLSDAVYFGQALEDRVTLPPGVAVSLAADVGLRVAVQYGNQGVADAPANVDVSLTPVDGTVQEAGLGLLTWASLSVPSAPLTSTFDVTCPIDRNVDLFAATGHLQSHGDAITGQAGGTTLFAADPWDRALAVARLQPAPVPLTSGGAVSLSCRYRGGWSGTGAAVFGDDYFGPQEQCSLYVYYYPVTQGAPWMGFCN